MTATFIKAKGNNVTVAHQAIQIDASNSSDIVKLLNEADLDAKLIEVNEGFILKTKAAIHHVAVGDWVIYSGNGVYSILRNIDVRNQYSFIANKNEKENLAKPLAKDPTPHGSKAAEPAKKEVKKETKVEAKKEAKKEEK